MLWFLGILKIPGFVFMKTNVIYNHGETCEHVLLNLI